MPLPDDPTPQQLREWALQRAPPGGGGFGFLRTAQRRQQSQQEIFSLQVLSELFPQRCVIGSVKAAAPGASESATALGASESAAALNLMSASRCFFCDCSSLTPLAALVPVSLADPTGGPLVARASTVLLCPAVSSSSLSGLHLPPFSTNLVSNAAIQDVWVDTFIPGGQRVAIYSPLAQPPRSPLPTASPRYALPSPCLSTSKVPALPPRSPAPPCLPCVEGRQCAAPHSSSFPLTTAPLQTLHMDVWGLAPIGGTDQERYFLLIVEDYSRYTTVYPLRRKANVSGVLIPWIRATRCQLRERFSQDFPVLRLHSDRGGEFSSDLLAEFCRDDGIAQSFTLPASPQQNGIAERRIGLIME
ncbi:unnamed protein product, partial [Closterium sp. NIES-54]